MLQEIKAMVVERDTMLETLDIGELKKFCKKYQVPVSTNDTICMAAMCKGAVHATNVSAETKAKAIGWLTAHGMSTYMG